MTSDVLSTAEEKMKKAVSALARDFKTLRAGRANPSILDKIHVDYYGTATPLNQLANVSAPEPRLLVVQAWDKSIVADIEKAILKSDIGLTPNSDGTIIRLSIPELTQETRKELVKVVRKKTEEARVVVRNIRREANDELKGMEKNKDISEDETRRAQEEVQNLTNKYVKELDNVLETKESEIMEI